MKYKQLNEQVTLPMLGYGTWKMDISKENETLLYEAANIGFEYIDTAMMYDNEEMIGSFINNCQKKRSDLFISTKIANNIGTYEETIQSIQTSLDKLQSEYIDLVLIHWPSPIYFRDHWQARNKEVYRALEDMYKANKIKSIGISNFMRHHVEALLLTATIKPVLNQIECHPYNVDLKTINYCKENDIVIQCYSPLGQGSVLKDKVIQDIAKIYNKTEAQIVLNWHLACDRLVVTNSSNYHHLKQNFNIFDFTLSEEEIEKLSSLSKEDGRILMHPDHANY